MEAPRTHSLAPLGFPGWFQSSVWEARGLLRCEISYRPIGLQLHVSASDGATLFRVIAEKIQQCDALYSGAKRIPQ